MLPVARSYEELRSRFRWRIPQRFNIARGCVDRHAERRPESLALIEEREKEPARTWTMAELSALSRRFANALAERGVGRGDRVAILLSQRVETLLAHLAVYRLGAIAVPLFTLFGPDALAFRLADSGARALVTDAAGLEKVIPLEDQLPTLGTIWSVEPAPPPARLFWADVEAASERDPTVDTSADDPALLIYTSGTTGQPKGALHAHRVLLGHLPGVQLPQELFPQPGDRFWTPADWAWIGGLLDVLLPSLWFAVPVLAHRARRFDPEEAVRLMARHGIRNLFLPPTALRLLRRAEVRPKDEGVRLRSIGSGGERLGDETVAWAEEAFGCAVNEFYGQTEANLVVSSCRALFPRRPGSMGRPVPGHTVAIVDPEGRPLPPGETGVIAVQRPDPVMFLGYWNQPEATAAKFRGEWMLTGDLGRMDEDGHFTYLGREDDLISSAGYRIGPAEIEDCLMRHPAVALCAVIGVPDPVRGEKVKAYIVPQPGVEPGPELAADIQNFVKHRLAAHEYPREIAFVDALPLTATGKVRRSELRARERAGRGRDGA
ncbi:MAG: acyl-CoA synthetase [Geminicoccaceae bacterium]|nr:acyl-CoA synthetase [Geminicoccaceae bacterium]